MSQNSAAEMTAAHFECSVCCRPCKYFYYGVKCCEACKHFFRRSVSLAKEFKCKSGGGCDVIKEFSKCKRCRLDKCFTAGMNPRGVNASKFNGQKQQNIGTELVALNIIMDRNESAKWTGPDSPLVQKDFMSFISLKHLLEVEQKVRRIRDSDTPIPKLFYDRCATFELILDERKVNLLNCANKFLKMPNCNKGSDKAEKLIWQKGVFAQLPKYLFMDLLFVFETAKTFSFFERLDDKDKVALCSNIAMPLVVLSNGFYSAQQNCDAFSTPEGFLPITLFKHAWYKHDPTILKMSDQLLCKAIGPFTRAKMNTVEFVVLRAIIFAHMVSPGLSDKAQKMLSTEAEKFAALLMSILQTNYGGEGGARRYVELMALIEFVFNSGAKHRELLSYLSIVVDRNFDLVMPPVLAKVCTKGPVELHQLLPY
ncbi:hypothetical protein niasHT_018949 [Heterodera trifolii]|uniref:Uncharacterized protein n=1 Tax=Heterodera trifolii TaxID=157864 RepID=A0ABD2LG24_9BILA